MGHDLKGAVKAHEDALWSIKLAYHRSGLGESAPYIHGLDAAHEAWRSLLDELSRLQEENDRLHGAISWVRAPFVDDKTPAAELRKRIAFLIADADGSRALASQDQGGGDRG